MATDHRGNEIHAGKRTDDELHQYINHFKMSKHPQDIIDSQDEDEILARYKQHLQSREDLKRDDEEIKLVKSLPLGEYKEPPQ